MKILLPYDGSAHSEAALDFVSTMAALRELTTRVTLSFGAVTGMLPGSVTARVGARSDVSLLLVRAP